MSGKQKVGNSIVTTDESAKKNTTTIDEKERNNNEHATKSTNQRTERISGKKYESNRQKRTKCERTSSKNTK